MVMFVPRLQTVLPPHHWLLLDSWQTCPVLLLGILAKLPSLATSALVSSFNTVIIPHSHHYTQSAFHTVIIPHRHRSTQSSFHTVITPHRHHSPPYALPLRFSSFMHAFQICGGFPDSLARCAQLLEDTVEADYVVSVYVRGHDSAADSAVLSRRKANFHGVGCVSGGKRNHDSSGLGGGSKCS